MVFIGCWAMRIIELLVSPIFFSIRLPEAYQVADSLLLPPPSTISGALAYSYAVWKGMRFQESLEIFTDSWCFAIPCSVIIPSSIILRRLRLLQTGEPFARSKEDWERIINRLPKSVVSELEKAGLLNRSKIRYRHDFLRILRDLKSDYYWRYYGDTFFDAMIRRYVFAECLYLGGLIPIEDSFVPSFTRLGDTESYLAIKEACFIDSFKLRKIRDDIIFSDTYAFLSYEDQKIIEPMDDSPIQLLSAPRFLLERMHTERRRARYKYVLPAILPLKREMQRLADKDVEVFLPKRIKIRVISEAYVLSYNSKILGRELSIVVPKGIVLR